MDLKEWSEEMTRYQPLKWIMAIAILIIGWIGMKHFNRFIYGPGGIDPSLNYHALVLIVGWGFARWGITLAVAFPIRQTLEWIWKCIAHLIRHRKLDDASATKITDSVFTEERTIKALQSIRNGTRSFFRTGIWIGVIAGITNYFFIKHGPGLWGSCILGLGYAAWGYGWYKLGWYGWLPLPNTDDQDI